MRFTPDQLEWTLRDNGTSLVLLEGNPQSEGFYERSKTLQIALGRRRRLIERVDHAILTIFGCAKRAAVFTSW